MRIQHSLNEKAEMLLNLLHITNKISYDDLKYLFEVASNMEYDFDLFIKAICNIKDPEYGKGDNGQTSIINAFKENDRDYISEEIDGLIYLGLVKLTHKNNPIASFLTGTKYVELTDEGNDVAERIHNKRRIIIKPTKMKRNTIFIASAFGKKDIDVLYEKHYEPTCKKMNYKPVRVDFNEPLQTITEEIMEGIVKSECLIADLSYARPSVYFEIGFAHGLGIPLLLTCRKDHYKGKNDSRKVHFDLEQYKISFWSISQDNIISWDKNMMPEKRIQSLVNKFEYK